MPQHAAACRSTRNFSKGPHMLAHRPCVGNRAREAVPVRGRARLRWVGCAGLPHVTCRGQMQWPPESRLSPLKAPAPPPPPSPHQRAPGAWASATWPTPSGHLLPNTGTPRRRALCAHFDGRTAHDPHLLPPLPPPTCCPSQPPHVGPAASSQRPCPAPPKKHPGSPLWQVPKLVWYEN